jgi:hypothetical protein
MRAEEDDEAGGVDLDGKASGFRGGGWMGTWV